MYHEIFSGSATPLCVDCGAPDRGTCREFGANPVSPVVGIIEENVEVMRLILQECVQQRTTEESVEVLVAQIHEQIVRVDTVFPRDALVNGLPGPQALLK